MKVPRHDCRRIGRLLVAAAVLLIFGGTISMPASEAYRQESLDSSTTDAPATTEACPWPDGVPAGALPPAAPSWCGPLAAGAATFAQGSNSWVDEWQHGLTMASVGEGYREFTFGSLYRAVTFRHM